jgi:zinc/manganese transport system substrate-binding protein/manganese/iron transport system substrate-binding protein
MLVAVAGCLTVGVATGCGSGDEAPASGKMLKVVATTTQLTDFTSVIAGSRADVYDVVKANVDAHDFEPSPADLEAIRDADVVIQNGVGLETWLEETIDSAAPSGEVVDASKGVEVRAGAGADEKDGDPHIWFAPENAKVMVANITKALVAVDPSGASTYQANQRAYAAELDSLDAEIASALSGLTNKKLVSNHDAFGYYVERYGLEFVGSVIPSFDTQAELSSGDIAELVDKIKAEGVKAVFSEASLPPKTAEAIASQAGVKVVEGDDALFSDSLGPPGSGGDTYLKMQRHNTKVIVENLR